MDRHLDARHRRHLAIERALARADDGALVARLDPTPSDGWGRSQPLVVAGHRVFVKRLPVTARELAHLGSTQNLFRLPMYYHYGVGSAGFGSHRELYAHALTSRWVLEGATEGFAILHHHRLVRVPRRPAAPPDLDEYVRYWNGSRRVGRFLAARAAAPAELLLFLEHVPHTAARWLARRSHRFPWLIDGAREALVLMRRRGMLHLDAQAFNLLTDGERVYVTDFGLALSRDFALDAEERAFFDAHQRYDDAELHYNLGAHVVRRFRAAGQARRARIMRRCDLATEAREPVMRGLLEHLDAIGPELRLDASFIELARRFRPVILHMESFFTRMTAGREKDVPFDPASLERAWRRAVRGRR